MASFTLMAQIAVLVSIVLNTASGAFHSVTAGKWNYDYNSTNTVCTTTNKCGPDNWHYINSPTNHCNGTHQSPININRVVVDTTLTYPDMYAANGGCSKWTQFVDDHAFETSFVESGCTSLSLAFKGVNYTLQQMHFHSPSEHTIGGGFADAEVHMVHLSSSGHYLVVGVLLDAANDHVPVNTNEFLDNFWTAAEDYSGVVNGYYNASTYAQQYEVELDNPVNPYTAFLPANKEYYHYNGSLTTYPCTEGIKWIVMAEPVRISPDDLTKLRESIATHPKTIISWQGNDNRPVQSLNGRTVLKYNGKDGVDTTTNNLYYSDYDADAAHRRFEYLNHKVDRATQLASVALALVGFSIVVVVPYLIVKAAYESKLPK